MAGPVWHGGVFSDGTGPEELWNAALEGRAHLGLGLGRVTLALYPGYQQAGVINPGIPTSTLTGGGAFGLRGDGRGA